MCKLVLDRGSIAEFTSVSNIFMDEYMPRANGEFIKIYLHLLRLVNSNNDIADELTTERIADKFNMLESDVIRALNYWAEQNLITLSYNSQNEISGITLESILRNRYIVKGITSTETNLLASASGQSESIPVPESTGHVIPAKRKYTPREILDFADNDTFNDVQLLAQTYLGRPLSSNDINSILYMIDGLCFDADFIEYIMDACISDGFNSLSSIEKRAVEYAKKDINSIEEAKADKKFREGISKSIYKIFGQAPTVPVRKEIAYIAKWTDTYGFTDEIIIEACNRTMAHMHSGNLFNYTDGILTRWYTNNVKDMSDIEKLDKLHSEEMSKTFQKNIPFANAKFSRLLRLHLRSRLLTSVHMTIRILKESLLPTETASLSLTSNRYCILLQKYLLGVFINPNI